MGDAGLFDVLGRVICVTGASSGLGRAAATMLAGAGARVVGVARRGDALASWQNEAGGDTSAVTADLADRAALGDIASEIATPFGPVDILINAAGLNPRKPAEELTAQDWDATQNINVAAPFFLAQAMVSDMKSKGWGRVINFASLQSRRAFANGIAYGTAKGGVEQMTRAMAEAWSRDGVTANAIAPGFFPTELTAPVFASPELAQRNADQTCIGRNGTDADLHGPLMFFCSKASDYVTGQILFVDGGFTAK